MGQAKQTVSQTVTTRRTLTVRGRGGGQNKNSDDLKPTTTSVSVAPHVRVINGKVIQVGGYTYSRKA